METIAALSRSLEEMRLQSDSTQPGAAVAPPLDHTYRNHLPPLPLERLKGVANVEAFPLQATALLGVMLRLGSLQGRQDLTGPPTEF